MRTKQALEHVETVNGSDLHYWTYHHDVTASSDGPPIMLMVHGLRGTHHGLELLAEQLDEFRVVVPDLPGFGASAPMAGRRHDVAGFAGAMIALIERLGGRMRPLLLLGHSLGSVIAAHVASARPELVHRLILINPLATPPLRGPRVVLSGLTSAYYSLGKVLPEGIGRAWLSNKLVVRIASESMTQSRDRRLRRFVYASHLGHFNRFHSPAVLSETYESTVSNTVADYARSVTMPTLLVAGAADDIAPVAGQRVLADSLPDAELVVIPRVGHLVHYETPGLGVDAIKRFLHGGASTGAA